VEPREATRLRLTVHYDGSAYHGWQLQPDLRTVQGELERALSRLAGGPRTVIGAGRTDTGVHATGQVASVDMPAHWDGEKLRRALNAVLPHDLWVSDAERVRKDFHPRYDALLRTYQYYVGTSPRARSPFHRGRCWALCEPVDVASLRVSAAAIVGERSFRAFAKAGQPERGERCRVERAIWDTWELGPRFTVTANRYLHQMVRYLVGTMVDIARGRRPAAELGALLAGESGFETSPPAPPQGLFLAKVEYADHVRIPDESTLSGTANGASA
jgi:tRNA pseudouridine38-40 synthase